jgi:hypothetical protein
MGHEVPGMRGIYAHITPRMRAELVDGLQQLWEASLHERARLSERSAAPLLDGLLASRKPVCGRARSQIAPKIGQ